MPTEADTTQAQVDAPGAPPLIDVDPPEVKPAPAAEAKKTDTPAATDENANTEAKPETPEQQEVKKESRRQRKFERERTARIQAETETRLLREQLAAHQAPKAEAKPVDDGPKRDAFDDYESYLEARSDWRVDQKVEARLKADRESRQSTDQQNQRNAGQEKTAQDWVKREQTFQKQTEDYEDVVTPYVSEELSTMSEGARRVIVDSEVGPQLLYHLASNTETAERIAALPPHRQVVELGKLEATLAQPPVRTTTAPPPLKTITGGKSASSGYDDNMSDEDFAVFAQKSGLRTFQKRH